MTEAPKGTKQMVLGGVLAGLGILTVFLSRSLGFALDPFYGAIGVAGVVLVAVGAVRKRADGKRQAAYPQADSSTRCRERS